MSSTEPTKTREEIEEKARAELEGLRGKTLTNRMRLSIPVQEMPTQDPQVRRSNMSEVATGYTKSQAMLEAQRCLQCKNAPCVAGCPVRVDIPAFIARTREGDFVDLDKNRNLSICRMLHS